MARALAARTALARICAVMDMHAMRSLRRLLFLPALTLGPQAHAQAPASSSALAVQTRLDWLGTELYVTADSAEGVGVWVFGHGRDAPHPVASRFRPRDVFAWLPAAERVIEGTSPTAADSAGYLQAPPLRDALGGAMLVARRLDGRRPADTVVVTFLGNLPERRFVIRSETRLVRDLLAALERSAHAGRYDAGRAESEARQCPRPGGTGPDSLIEAWPVSVPPITYPASLEGRREGHVVIEYAVDTTGRVDPASLRVRYATDPLFGEAASAALRGARFTPATVRGTRVGSCVDAVVHFRPAPSASTSRPRLP